MRTTFAYSFSFFAHVAVLGWLHWSLSALPEAWQVQDGRASVQLIASMDSQSKPAEPQKTDEAVAFETPEEPEKPVAATTHDRSELPVATTPKPERHEPPPSAPPTPPKLKRVDRTELVAIAELKDIARREQDEPEVEVAMVDSKASPSSQAIEGTDIDEPPRKLQTNPLPRYPGDAYSAGIQGTVILAVTVTTEGTVSAIHIEKSSGNASIDASAIETVWRWRFNPGRRRGIPAAIEALVPVNFYIRGR
ncbi:MAG TPA: energy transducer TonB [Pirellulales bacterium]|jgi:protein TonB|nr:energy transducer TonB [Pirellulales bacterium]